MFYENDLGYGSMISISKIIADNYNGIYEEHNDEGFTTAAARRESFYSRQYITDHSKDVAGIIRHCAETAAAGGPNKISFITELMPGDYESLLTASGYTRLAAQHSMWAYTDRLVQFPPFTKGEIRRIERDELDEWKDTMQKGFGKQRDEQLLYEVLFDSKRVRFYGCFIDGKIVGTAMTAIDGDLSGMHEGAVLPEYRRLGIITSLIMKMTSDLRDLHIGKVSLQASDMGHPVYASAGIIKTGMIETWFFEQ
ncbi:MAG: GNAT family N-acetyltransferase [Lachnospiraceae bacterium]|nr:GNAT family N-acetyltransferase [Lachnospiraceae bacterium]